MQEQAQKLRWLDHPLKELGRLAAPMTASMLSLALMTLVDTLFVAHLGRYALAGLGLAGVLSFTLICFPIGLARGGTVLISKAFGANRQEEVQAFLGASLWVSAVLGLVLMLLGVLGADLLRTFTTTVESGDAAVTYFRIRALAAPGAIMFSTLREGRHAVGDSRAPMLIGITGNLVNIALDAVFIFGLDAGVAGAAWATVAARWLQFFLLATIQKSDGFGLRLARPHHVREILRMGIPTGVQVLFELISFTILSTMISKMGDVDVASHQVAIQVWHFGFLPAIAISDAGAVMVGQALGAGRRDLIPLVVRITLLPTLAWAVVCGSIFAIFDTGIAGLFGDDPAVGVMSAQLLVFAGMFQIIDAFNIVYRSLLRGTGDVQVPALVGIVLSWIFLPPLAWYFGHHLAWGAVGAWLGLGTEMLVCGIYFGHRLYSGAWKKAADRDDKALLDVAQSAQ